LVIFLLRIFVKELTIEGPFSTVQMDSFYNEGIINN
jgi:hypothetical protein